jgi:hypothetical protein
MSAEDLTTQAGLSVQQDLALVNLLGITHVERNGHHYVDGMAALPRRGAAAKTATARFLRRAPRPVRTHSTAPCGCTSANGRIALGSLAWPGFASAAMPDWACSSTHDAGVLTTS